MYFIFFNPIWFSGPLGSGYWYISSFLKGSKLYPFLFFNLELGFYLLDLLTLSSIPLTLSSAHTQAYIYLNHILYILISLKNRLVIKISPQSWDEKSFISNSSSDSGFPWGTFRETENLDRASLIAQLVKNLPAMQETQVRFLGQEDPLEKRMATHSSILGLSS